MADDLITQANKAMGIGGNSDAEQDIIALANRAVGIGMPASGPSKAERYWDSLKSGVATGIGNVADAGPRLYNLAKIAVGKPVADVIGAVTGRPAVDFYPEITSTGTMGTDVNTTALKGLFGVKDYPAESFSERLGRGIVSGAGGGLVSPTGSGSAALDVVRSIAIGGMAGGGAVAGGEATGGSAAGQIGGALLGGMVLPALFGKYSSGASALLNQSAEQAKTNAAPFVQRIVEGQTKRAVQGAPAVPENIDRGLQLRQTIPGFNPSVGEMAGAPALLDMQRRYAMSDPRAFNAEVARNQSNAAAVDQYFNSTAPPRNNPTVVRSVVNQNMADAEKAALAQQQSVAAKVPSADQMAVGTRLEEIARAERAAARPAITAAYEQAFKADPRKAIDLAPVIAKTEEILGTKLSEIKPDTAPATVRAIQALKAPDKPPTGFGFTQELTPGAPGVAKATLRDVDALRKAINMDMAAAAGSNNPAAATQLRNLYQLHKTIDDTVAATPLKNGAGELYQQAIDKYRTEFAPRFKEGANMRVFQPNSYNEPKILPDKFTSEYFKPDSQGGLTRASQFGNLYGKNPEALETTKAGIIDRYRDTVVNKDTGVIDMAAHNRFLANHRDTLDAFKKAGVNVMDDIKGIGAEAHRVMQAGNRIQETAKGLRYNTVDDLVDAAIKSPRVMGSVLPRLNDAAREQLQRLIMDRARGGDISKFIQDNRQTLNMALKPAHITALEDISDALKIMKSSPISGALATEGPDIVKNMTGVSTATVWAQYRAVTGGRQGLATGVFNLAAPVATKLGKQQFSEIMENALHNPETARNLRDFLLAQNASQASAAGNALSRVKEGANLVWDARGPIARYLVGTKYYGPNLARSQATVGAPREDRQQ